MMQSPQDMDTLIANELEEGERVLWSGRPNPHRRSSTSASPTAAFYVMTAVFGLLGLTFLLIAIVVPASSVHTSNGSHISDLFFLSVIGIPFLLLALIFGVLAVAYRPNLRGTAYAITERRIVSITAGKWLTVYSYGKEDIGILNRIEQPDGTGDLTFITNRQISPYGAYYGGYNGGTATNSIGTLSTSMNSGKFVSIPNVREVERIVRRTFK